MSESKSDSKSSGSSGSSTLVGLSPIAQPLADEKLATRALKLARKAAKAKSIRRGVKEVMKAIRKKEKGIMLFAGNVSPVEVIAHIPIVCEENGIPYFFVPAKEDLGAASATKRPTCCVMIVPNGDPEFMESFNKVKKQALEIQVEW